MKERPSEIVIVEPGVNLSLKQAKTAVTFARSFGGVKVAMDNNGEIVYRPKRITAYDNSARGK